MRKSQSSNVDTENHGPAKKFEEFSVDHGSRKISSADTGRHGLVKVFEEETVDHNVNVNCGVNMATRRPAKTCDNQTSKDGKPVSQNQSAADRTQSSSCSEMDIVTADGGRVQEKNMDVQNVVGQLSSRLTAEELHQVYSRVFYRR